MTDDATRDFGALFRRFLEDVVATAPTPNTFRALLSDHLGADVAALPLLTEAFAPAEHPNVQLALDAYLDDLPHRLVGAAAQHKQYSGMTLADLIAGSRGAVATGPVDLVNVATGVDTTMPCVQFGLYLVDDPDGPLCALLRGPVEHSPRAQVALDVMAADAAHAGRFLEKVKTIMGDVDVYRGQVLSFDFSEYGSFDLSFHRLPRVERSAIVLPEATLDAIERHAIGIGDRSDELRRAGSHVKRGILLYGPPGTGKTLTIMYLAGRMPDRTVLLLTGRGLAALGQAGALARKLQPAMVVLEDVDLVAMERTMPGLETNPLLFQLLNEMDGLAEDEDVVFVLTTNRVDLLEPALAARPGRIDQAVELGLPDVAARRTLLRLYAGDDADSLVRLDEHVRRTAGASPAFIKELVRRARLRAIEDGDVAALGDTHVAAALDDLLEHSEPLLRSLLGAQTPEPRRGDGGREYTI